MSLEAPATATVAAAAGGVLQIAIKRRAQVKQWEQCLKLQQTSKKMLL